MDFRAETTRFGPTSHTQMSSELIAQDSTIGLAQDRSQVGVCLERKEIGPGMKQQEVAAWIGLDWADKKHSIHLQVRDGKREHRMLEQKPDIIHEWVAELRQPVSRPESRDRHRTAKRRRRSRVDDV